MTIRFTIAIRTSNPNNGATGHSRLAGIIRSRERKAQRFAAWMCARAADIRPESLPCTVTVTRVAPSAGLDPHDGLGAALKGCIDGIADALGLKNDRDPRVTWVLAQRRGRAGLYAVDVTVESRACTLERCAPSRSSCSLRRPAAPLTTTGLPRRRPVNAPTAAAPTGSTTRRKAGTAATSTRRS